MWKLLINGSLLLGLLALATLPAMTQEEGGPAPELALVLDASGSMWGQIKGENKIVIARRVIGEALAGLADDAVVGLIAYGHRREGDCDDIETLVPLGKLDRDAMAQTLASLNPKGKTPIGRALKTAFEAVKERPGPTSVILVSDGLETCGADPCQIVRDTRAAGANLVVHVVGFDVKEDELAQLECIAQAGGGSFYGAADGAELSTALAQATVAVEEIPAGGLSIKATANGELADVAIRVVHAETGAEAAGGRTYRSPETNPRFLPLADGVYNVTVKAVGMRGQVERSFRQLAISGAVVEKTVDFSAGELAVVVTRNGEPTDATVHVYAAGTRREAAKGRTYSRPRSFTLTAGSYDLSIKALGVAGGPTFTIKDVAVEGQARVERSHDFASGGLRVGAVAGGELVDAVVYIAPVEGGGTVAQSRTYAAAKSNPRRFELEPGRYRVTARPVKQRDKQRQLEVEIKAGETVDLTVDFADQ